jgi:hypothetical protein
MNFALLTALLACCGFAHAADKFNAQDLRKSFVADCTMRGISKGADAEKTAKWCGCSFDTMASNMTVAEYLEVDRVGRAGGNPGTLPQMQRVLPRVGAACKE